MTSKAIVTWIGVVSGLLTILLVFKNPFQNAARLEAYIETQEIISKPIEDSRYAILYDGKEYVESTVVKLTLKNKGELPAKKIHIKFDNSYDRLIIKSGKIFKKLGKNDPLYIENLEPDGEIELFYFNDSYLSSYYRVARDFSISSPDSGKAIIRTEIIGEGLIWYIEEYLIFIIMFLLLTFYFMLISIINLHEKSKKAKVNETSDIKNKMDQLSHAWALGILNEDEFKIEGKKLIEKELRVNK